MKIKSEAEKVSENIEDSSGASKALMDTATMVGNKQLQKDKSSQQRNRQSWEKIKEKPKPQQKKPVTIYSPIHSLLGPTSDNMPQKVNVPSIIHFIYLRTCVCLSWVCV